MALLSACRALAQRAVFSSAVAASARPKLAVLNGSAWAGASPAQALAPMGAEVSRAGFHASSWAASSVEVTVPPLGESVADGTVATILKQVGDSVKEDEPILQIETDKVTVDVRAPKAGVVEKLLVSADDNVTVGTLLARIGAASSSTASSSAPRAAAIEAASSSASEEEEEHHARHPSIHFPPRRTSDGRAISSLPCAEAREILAALGEPAPADEAPAAAPAKPAVPISRIVSQYDPSVTIMFTPLSAKEQEAIMLGGALD